MIQHLKITLNGEITYWTIYTFEFDIYFIEEDYDAGNDRPIRADASESYQRLH